MKSEATDHPKVAVISASMWIGITLAIAFLGSLPCGATNFYVDTTQDQHDASPGNGVCATSSGTCSLRAAVEEANSLAGTDVIYVGSRTVNLGSSLTLNSDMTIDGTNFLNTEIHGSGLDRVFEITGTSTVTIKELRITGGWAISADGGLIHVGFNASTTVKDCRLETGLADNGGCIATEGDLFLDHTTVFDCSAGNRGGGIAVLSGSTTLSANSEVTNNDAIDGGGVSLGTGLLTVENGTVNDNYADPSTGRGGGIFITGGSNHIRSHRIGESQISGNSAANGGGIYLGGTAWIKIVSSVVNGNNASGSGGGYFFAGGGGFQNSTIENTTFTGNTADHHGGAVYSEADGSYDVELFNCTITNNTTNADASGGGDGGGISQNGSAEVHLRNTLVAGNDDGSTSGDTFENPDCWGDLTSVGYNLIGIVSPLCSVGGVTTGNLTGDLTTPLNAMLGPAASCYGGIAHPLLTGSPAKEAGNPAGCYGPDGLLFTDQCLENRTVGSRCDIGAVEDQDAPNTLIFSDGFENGTTGAWS